MGYVPPPGPSASDLIREDLEPTIASLYTLATVTDVSRSFLGGRVRPRLPRSYEEYRQQLYGDLRHDWWPTITTILLIVVAALAVALVLLDRL